MFVSFSSSSSSYGGLRHQPFISSAADPPPEHFHEALDGRLLPFSSTFFAAQYSNLHRSSCSLSLPLRHHYYYHGTTSGDLHDQPPPLPPYSSSPSSSSCDCLDFHAAPVRLVLSTGDLQGTQYGSLEGSAHPPGRVGRYNAEERKERIERYRSKRNQRNFQKKITYACRKTLADSRPRVRGRFAKNGDEKEMADMAAVNGYVGSGVNQSHAFGSSGGSGDWWSPEAMMAAEDEDELYCDGGFLSSFADHDAFAMNSLS
ncbi:uncharacterized protein LOC141820443 [Curcuma longa]|uniref:uncharacterized protein LOC141820443 n=1 Tax=Curcuma longa TaxID=136217 RepID=UPI003D9EE579